MAEDDDKDDGGKVSIGDALEAIRSGKKIAVPKKAMPSKPPPSGSRTSRRVSSEEWTFSTTGSETTREL